jgi:hypothetical protein
MSEPARSAFPSRCLALAALLALASGCVDADAPAERPVVEPGPAVAPAEPASVPSVTLYFTRGEQPIAVVRTLDGVVPTLHAALAALLEGPTAAERAGGITSWFSTETAGRLRSVEVDSAGHAVVDFEDLAAVIPSASSSAGSAMLLAELNGTVFAFPEVRTVEYRSEGSCETFWNWLQYDCQVVTRPAR